MNGKDLDYLSEQISDFYENTQKKLNLIHRELITLNSRISNIENRMNARDMREMNKKIRKYGMDKSNPIHFIPSKSNN